jgi:small subunit ribosomal protein S6
MKQYECMYILKPNLEEDARNALIEKFSGIVTANGGEVVKVDEWGKKKLAYAINYIEDGYYILLYFKSVGDLPRELERNFKISEDVMRYMVVVDQNVKEA